MSEQEVAEALAEMQSSSERFTEAELAGDLSAVLRFYSEDILILDQDGNDIDGRAALEAVIGEFLAANSLTEFQVEAIEREVYGDTAFELGRYRETIQPREGEVQHLRGNYMAVRVRQPDGMWLWHRLVTNHRIISEHEPIEG
jgi:uncharacterized protein (TIGR02246 family)